MNGWDLATPLALLLAPLPLLCLLLPPVRERPAAALRVPDTIRARLSSGDATTPGEAGRRWLAWLAWFALVVALASPRAVAVTAALPASGRDIMLALDLSGSMVAEDFKIDGQPAARIDALKKVGAELIRRRAGDRVGLVIFAQQAFAPVPLSFDVANAARALEQATIGLVGRSTAIGEGLGLALKRLSESTASSRVIILLSDGSNNIGASDPLPVAALAKSLGVKLHTIGLGIHDTDNPEEDPDPVDFAALKLLAETGGGQAFRARTTEDLDEAVRAIEALTAGEIAAPPAVIFRDFWIWPAMLALAAGLALLRQRRAPA